MKTENYNLFHQQHFHKDKASSIIHPFLANSLGFIMYAVIKTGGKQYRVSEGETLKIEKLEIEPGKKVTFKEVLMVADGEKVQVGSPLVEKASVEAKVVSQGKGKKINILKFKRRKHSMKQQGHRQLFTEVQIGKIKV